MPLKKRLSLYESDSEEESKQLLQNVVNESHVRGAQSALKDVPCCKVANGNVAPTLQTGGYVEFFSDSVPCPTCRGSGRIHKDDEKKLVAIIPLTDKRLKPRRTFVYIIITFLLCIIAGALLLFFLIPRNVEILNNSPMLTATRRSIDKKNFVTNLTVVNCYNFSNHNYYAVEVGGMLLTAQLKRDLSQASQATYEKHISVPPRTVLKHCMPIVILIKGYYFAEWCMSKFAYLHDILVIFKLTANYTVLNQDLQTTLSTLQYVDCGNTSLVSPLPIITSTRRSLLFDG